LIAAIKPTPFYHLCSEVSRKDDNMIQIKAFFGDWKEATKDEAKKFVRNLESGMMCKTKKKIEIINKNHLRGITYEELFD
jgi:hypothetical protein